jgi:hypothetical protein
MAREYWGRDVPYHHAKPWSNCPVYSNLLDVKEQKTLKGWVKVQ